MSLESIKIVIKYTSRTEQFSVLLVVIEKEAGDTYRYNLKERICSTISIY